MAGWVIATADAARAAWEQGPSLDAVFDGVRSAVDVAGLIPLIGDAADVVNAGISLARGNYEDAALSLAAAVRSREASGSFVAPRPSTRSSSPARQPYLTPSAVSTIV